MVAGSHYYATINDMYPRRSVWAEIMLSDYSSMLYGRNLLWV